MHQGENAWYNCCEKIGWIWSWNLTKVNNLINSFYKNFILHMGQSRYSPERIKSWTQYPWSAWSQGNRIVSTSIVKLFPQNEQSSCPMTIFLPSNFTTLADPITMSLWVGGEYPLGWYGIGLNWSSTTGRGITACCRALTRFNLFFLHVLITMIIGTLNMSYAQKHKPNTQNKQFQRIWDAKLGEWLSSSSFLHNPSFTL